MQRLLKRAGLQGDVVNVLTKVTKKPSMKDLRALKPTLDAHVRNHTYDYVIAAGETASRLVLDTSSVNITRLRGREFEYAYGVKDKQKRSSKDSTSDESK
jgi:uracil-DNA glycosylase